MTSESEKISVKYGREQCVVRLQSDISSDAIFRLCEEIDLSIEYYQYNNIIIEIDSKGGSTSYLEYYFHRLRDWIELGIMVETVGLTISASAAAYILCCASPGKRRVYPSTVIAFHYSSVHSSSDSSLNRLELEQTVSRIKDIDDRFITFLTDSVVSALHTGHYDKYPVYYEGADRKHLHSRWNDLGIPQQSISLGYMTSAIDIVREIIVKIHELGRELDPQTARSFLLVDNIIGVTGPVRSARNAL